MKPAKTRLYELLRDKPKSISSIRETMLTEGYHASSIEWAAMDLNVRLTTIGKGRSKLNAWELPPDA